MKKTLLLSAIVFASFAGVLSAQCNGALYDGFESGSYTPTWSLAGSQVYSVTTTNPAVGTYRLEGTGGNLTHLTGLTTSFAAATPSEMSWWICPQTSGSSHNYFLAGNASISATNCIVFCYYQSSGNLTFISSINHAIPATLNTWYHIELRNINWTAHTFDIYVDNVLQYTGFPFRSATQNDVSRVHLYNYNTGTGAWDDIRLGNMPPLSAASFTAPTCNAGTNGMIDQTITSGTAPFTYSWSNGGTTEDLNGIAAGTYTVTVTDNLGCTVTNTVVVTEPTAITSSNTQTDILCNGGNNGDAMVSASGGTPGYTYSWSSGGTAAMESGLMAGTYTATITDLNGCTNQQVFTITQPTALLTAASGSSSVCPNDTAMLVGTAMGGTPGYSYLWLPMNTSGSTATDVPSGTTTYTLVVTDANGCSDSSTTTVAVNVPPTVNLGADTTVCLGMFLDAQNPGSTYLWNDNSTLQQLGVTATGTYFVTVTDINGCSASDTINVGVDVQPNGGIISSSGGVDVCPGDSVFLSSVNDVGTLDWWVMLVAAPFWQNIGTGNPFTHGPVAIADTGTYQFMAIASNGVCPDDTSNLITVIVHVPPVVNLSDTVVCGGVVLHAGNVGPSTTYLWNDQSVQEDLTVMQSGNYSVIVTDMFGCTGTDSANVTVNPYPTGVTANASSLTACLDDGNIILTGAPVGGVWTGPGVVGSQFDPSIGVGAIPLTYTFTDTTNGCAASAAVTITVNACVGVNEIAEGAGMNVYPNPNNGAFNIALSTATEKLYIEITDAQGRTVYSAAESNVQPGAVRTIDVSNEAAGIYIMRVTTDTQQFNHQVIIAK